MKNVQYLQETTDTIMDMINQSLKKLKTENYSDAFKVDFMGKLLDILSRKLSLAFQTVIDMADEYDKLKEEYSELAKDFAWCVYDRNTAVNLLQRHVAVHPNATEEDIQAGRYALNNSPVPPAFPRREQRKELKNENQ